MTRIMVEASTSGNIGRMRVTLLESDRPMPPERVPAHRLMAQLGKTVLRPGGVGATEALLDQLDVGPEDDVVELRPGPGATARRVLLRGPRSYVGVERDAATRSLTIAAIAGREGETRVRVVRGDVTALDLRGGVASVLLCEAVMSMHERTSQVRVIAEAARLLRDGGRLGIHELAFHDERVPERVRAQVQRELSEVVQVPVHVETPGAWQRLLEGRGFAPERVSLAPIRLLEPDGLLRDEGLLGATRFSLNVARDPIARRRIDALRRIFRRHQDLLRAIVLVGRRRPNGAAFLAGLGPTSAARVGRDTKGAGPPGSNGAALSGPEGSNGAALSGPPGSKGAALAGPPGSNGSNGADAHGPRRHDGSGRER
ncbi:MAG: methyltransferase domain-containing protein [Myxococcales bacterium]|nr:methyltransferase domain-containing protein [Myxococcales bacterium]